MPVRAQGRANRLEQLRVEALGAVKIQFRYVRADNILIKFVGYVCGSENLPTNSIVWARLPC
jgi:hypothetical protein